MKAYLQQSQAQSRIFADSDAALATTYSASFIFLFPQLNKMTRNNPSTLELNDFPATLWGALNSNDEFDIKITITNKATGATTIIE
jgi:hypothetical protein